MKFKDEYRDGFFDDIYFNATMIDFKIDTDLSSVYGDFKNRIFKPITESIKKTN